MTRHRTLTGAWILLAVSAVAQNPLALETQFGETVPILGDGQPRLIVYADRDGAAQTDGWREALQGIDCPATAAAHLAAVPAIARSMVRSSFEEEEDPVALDWQGRIAERLGFEAGQANVYLIDGRGREQVHLHGAASKADLDPLLDRAGRLCASTR